MREFSKISPRLWGSGTFRKLPDGARLLFLYYLTCSHQNSGGCFSLPDGYAITDLSWGLEQYQASRALLLDAALIRFDSETSEILVAKWFRHNPPMNPSHRKSVVGAIERIASSNLQGYAREELERAELDAKTRQESSAAKVAIQHHVLLRSRHPGTPRGS